MLQQLFGGMADPASSIGLRALAAFLTSLAIGLALGPRFIARLKAMHFGQAVRTDGPQTHLKKDGTPTMGGALILGALTASLALWGDWSNRFLWVILFVTLGYGAIGWQDDYRKVVHHDPHGMSAREKFSWQSVIGLAAGFYLAVALSAGPGEGFLDAAAHWYEAGFPLDISRSIDLVFPAIGKMAFPFGILGFIAFVYVVIVGSSNAVNLTDGLDGLASPTWPGRALRALTSPRFPGLKRRPSSWRPWPGRDSPSFGSTRIRPRSSWATSVRLPWAGASERPPSLRAPSSCLR